MTTHTKSELATRLLRDLGLLGADETASSVDMDWAEETIDATFAALQRKGIRIWDSSTDAIPDEYLVLLSQRIGLDVAPSFGLMSMADAVAAKPLLEADLRTIATVLPTGGVADSTYF
jgi:hypothetical protein